MKTAAGTMARHVKKSDSWLWRFSDRHGITFRCTFDEAISAATKAT